MVIVDLHVYTKIFLFEDTAHSYLKLNKYTSRNTLL